VRFSFSFDTPKFSADLTIAVLGRLALWSYYPDTLLLWRMKNSKEAAQ
jgi:hypothetical protein